MLMLGVIADTHIPDRAAAIPQAALDCFAGAGLHIILHAGDISRPRILAQLAEIAPVLAVRGNLDWFGFDDLPMHRTLRFEGITLGMTHGQITWPQYIIDRFRAFIFGAHTLQFTLNKIRAHIAPNPPDVIVFGHNHIPYNHVENGTLFFNPGSPTIPNDFVKDLRPSVGLLYVDGESVTGEIVFF